MLAVAGAREMAELVVAEHDSLALESSATATPTGRLRAKA
jgi:hypothetical protein